MKSIWIINQYASTSQAGMGGRHFYLAEELAKLGYQVHLIASASSHLLREPPVFEGDFKIEDVAGFKFVWVNMPAYEQAHSKQRAINWFLFSWRIQKLTKIIKNPPNVVLCSSPSLPSFLGAQHLAKKFKARLVFEVRDIWPLTLIELGGYSPKHPFIRLLQWIERKAYRDSDVVLSNLKNSVEHMVVNRLRREKFTWIPNGFSLREVTNPLPLTAEIIEKIPKDKFIVGYTGTFGLANDLYTLANAAEIIKNQKDIFFVFVGGGREKADLQKYVKHRDLDNILFLDFINKKQIQPMLNCFDVLVLGVKKNHMYKFGVSLNKFFDYLFAGKPIVSYIESGNYTPVKDANCGFEVESENPQAIADAVLTLYHMPKEQREQMGANGRKAAMEQYEYGMLAKKLAKVVGLEG